MLRGENIQDVRKGVLKLTIHNTMHGKLRFKPMILSETWFSVYINTNVNNSFYKLLTLLLYYNEKCVRTNY